MATANPLLYAWLDSAIDIAFDDQPITGPQRRALHELLGPWLTAAMAALPPAPRDGLAQASSGPGSGAAPPGDAAPGEAAPGEAAPTDALWHTALRSVLLRAWGKQGLVVSAAALQALAAWLARQPTATQKLLLAAAIRSVVDKPRPSDVSTLSTALDQLNKELTMATPIFYIDDSSIPVLKPQAAKDALLAQIQGDLIARFGLSASTADVKTSPLAAAITGMVILDGEFVATSVSLQDALKRAWLASIGDMPRYPNGVEPLPSVFAFIAQNLPVINGNKPDVSYQELAFVARELIAGGQSIPFGHPSFLSAARLALDRFVDSRNAGDSLALPPGTLPGSTDAGGGDPDLNVDNIRVAGTMYAMSLLDRTGIFRVVDRVTELFMNGLLPFGHDAAGKALDNYYWDTEDRLSEGQRRSQFSRMLGMPGGEVSKEVQPNRDFEALFMRFIASVSEFTRQREVDRMFQSTRPVLSTTGEQVRKTALDVAKNASLYGWGGSFFIAARLNNQLSKAISILSMPQVLKAYAASNHWQVVERVSQQDFGGAPNYVKYTTMAQSAKIVFDLIAQYSGVLNLSNSTRPFLFDRALVDGNANRQVSDVSPVDTDTLLRNVQYWLAVNGVAEDQVTKYAQPVESVNVASLPGGSGSQNASGDVVTKLRAMVAGGASPSPDQLQQLLATLH